MTLDALPFRATGLPAFITAPLSRPSGAAPCGTLAGRAENGGMARCGMDREMDGSRHVPVLRDEVLAALQAADGGLFLDATFGAGGYTAAILANPGTRVLAMDIGVSSMQLDEAERGFSFRRDGPLDMRMGATGRTAADLVNTLDADALADVLYHYGEERLSRRIAKAIVMDRAATPFRTTAPLAALIARLVPHKPGDIHPATRSFQALRIAVNDELGELVAALAAAERLLKPGGRLAVVTFHSGEDRIVKQFLQRRAGRGEALGRRLPGEPARSAPSFTLPKGQPVAPTEGEARDNPRARSAKLRIGVRTDAPALPLDLSLSELASLPQRKPAGRPAQAGPAGRHGRTRP